MYGLSLSAVKYKPYIYESMIIMFSQVELQQVVTKSTV
jgi:hypothetical protein